MPTFTMLTEIEASREECFDLSRSIDLHLESMIASKERAVAATTVVVAIPTAVLGIGSLCSLGLLLAFVLGYQALGARAAPSGKRSAAAPERCGVGSGVMP